MLDIGSSYFPLRLLFFRPVRMASAHTFRCSGVAFCHRRDRPSAFFVSGTVSAFGA